MFARRKARDFRVVCFISLIHNTNLSFNFFSLCFIISVNIVVLVSIGYEFKLMKATLDNISEYSVLRELKVRP